MYLYQIASLRSLICVFYRAPCTPLDTEIHPILRRRPFQSNNVRPFSFSPLSPPFAGLTCFPVSYRWGQSAGSISVSLHMLINNGNTEGLFRGAFMDSGSPTSIPSDLERGQRVYNEFVREVGCADAQDTLECLRETPFASIQGALATSAKLYAFQVCAIHVVGLPS